LFLLAIFTVLGFGGIIWVKGYLADISEMLKTEPNEAMKQVVVLLRLAGFGVMVPLVGFGGYLIYLSGRAWQALQFPPPGTKVMCPTKVLRGKKARLKAAFGIACGGILIVSGVLIPFFVVRTIMHLLLTFDNSISL